MNGRKKKVLQEELILEFSEQIKQTQANKTEKKEKVLWFL
jgi:hypothetical protein